MIEYALLFGMGFLSAAFLAFLLAPAVHRRIVWYTETRMRATMPLSPQEVRAQKDMVRALYAAENARTTQELLREREKSLALRLKHDSLAGDAGRLAVEISDLQAHIDAMNTEAADLRSHARKDESYIGQLKTALHIAEQSSNAKEAEIDGLRIRMNRLAEQSDNLKIDIAARETEIESLKFKVNALRNERDASRQKAAEQTLAASVSHIAKKDKVMAVADPNIVGATSRMAEDLRKRAATTSQRIIEAQQTSLEDQAIREEMADIAAGMVAMVALGEGPSSPIHGILKDGKADDLSLAGKATIILSNPG